MKEIKTKSTIKDIKILDKTADISHRAKNTFIRTKEQAEQTQRPDHNSFVEYAEDKVKGGTETVAREAGHAVGHQSKKVVQKIKERNSTAADNNYTDATDGYTTEQTSRFENGNFQPGNRSTTSNKGKQTTSLESGKAPKQYNTSMQVKQSAQQKAGAQTKANETSKRKYTISNPNELAKRRFILNRVKARFFRSKEIQETETKTVQAVQSPVFRPAEKTTWYTGQTNISGAGRTIRQFIRPSNKAVKENTKGTIKTAQKSVKNAEQAAKTTVKTSQAAAKAAHATARVAQQTARASRAATQFTVRIIKLTVKAAAAMVKGLIALVGTGGAVLALFLIIFAVAALVSSPFGVFFSNENKDAGVTPISNVIQDVNTEFAARIEKIKVDHNDVDSVDINYVGSADNTRVDNWMDVVAVFAVKTAMNKENGMDVATIDTTRVNLIKSVFWDMNLINYYVETIAHTQTETVDNGDGTTSEKTTTTYEHILHITITSKTAEQQADEYGFTDGQKNIMEEMLSGEFRPMMYALLGMDKDTGLTAEQLQTLYNDLPTDELGSEAVKLALSRLGDPYSQPKAGQGDYTDCSYLVQWCYQQLGISLPRTASTQGKYCVDNGLTVSKSDLEPGDLVFWSFEDNDRFMNITHVGIYAGYGMVVDASSTRGQVVYRKLYDSGHQVLYGRPGLSK